MSWMERPQRAEDLGTVNGNRRWRVGRYIVEVPGEAELELQYSVEGKISTPGASLDRVLPSLDVYDGQVRLDLEDIAAMVLDRASPDELAAALWAHREVREAFCDQVVAGWSSSHFTDEDRRRLLRELRETIYDETVRGVLSVLQDREFETVKQHRLWDWADRVACSGFFQHLTDRLQQIRHLLSQSGPAEPALADCIRYIEQHQSSAAELAKESRPGWYGDEVTRVGGRAWSEARDYWRRRLEELFPRPREEASVAETGELSGQG